MKIYRLLGAWYQQIDWPESPIWTKEVWPGSVIHTWVVPLGIDPEVHEKYMDYHTRLGRWTFGLIDTWAAERLKMFEAFCYSEYNARAQYRANYIWVPKTVEAARLKFDLAYVLGPYKETSLKLQLKEYAFRDCWMVYKESVWLGRQKAESGEEAEFFELGKEVGDVFLFQSRDTHKMLGWPDRIATCYLWFDWIESEKRTVVKLFYRVAAIYLGLADHVDVDTYRLKKTYRERAELKSQKDAWKYW